MLCVWLSSVECAYSHEPQCHRRPVRSADVLHVGHVMTKLTMFENSPMSRFLSDRHAIFCPERSWPSSVRLRRERVNTTSGLPAACDRRWPVLTKCDFDTFDFGNFLTGSGNENRKSGSVRARDHVSCVQQWNPHVDTTSGWPAIDPLNLWKRVFLTDVWKFAKNPFFVRSSRRSGGTCGTWWPIVVPNLNDVRRRLLW